jgi:hypothetical protein
MAQNFIFLWRSFIFCLQGHGVPVVLQKLGVGDQGTILRIRFRRNLRPQPNLENFNGFKMLKNPKLWSTQKYFSFFF